MRVKELSRITPLMTGCEPHCAVIIHFTVCAGQIPALACQLRLRKAGARRGITFLLWTGLPSGSLSSWASKEGCACFGVLH